MSLYYFHFRQGRSYTPDKVGSEFASVEDAYLEAVRTAQDMWRELLIVCEDPLLCSFEVRDGEGNELFNLPFVEVLDACRGNEPAP